ncbi:hypothetical protein DPMN_162468 [Dreissena polymorpha]|uniref:Uncharacterized protein n=1 Tax=Dreissena polymorpha TaxID=45954 RepID=A0A9D4EU56_DREPO|nr:hypothetical protein DPMN_162468 [Dreissena polymorpha]
MAVLTWRLDGRHSLSEMFVEAKNDLLITDILLPESKRMFVETSAIVPGKEL